MWFNLACSIPSSSSATSCWRPAVVAVSRFVARGDWLAGIEQIRGAIQAMRAIVPIHRQLQDRGQSMTSPLYHPILPLLIDSVRDARSSQRQLAAALCTPQSADAQIRPAMADYQRCRAASARDGRPRPSAAVRRCSRATDGWIASDQGVLEIPEDGLRRIRPRRALSTVSARGR
jgi:hypothetical protein